jgi:hypothetical protein
MKSLVIAAMVVAACGLAFAGPVQDPAQALPRPVLVVNPPDDFPVDPGSPPAPLPPVNPADADRDGFVVSVDCNDDNPSVKPFADELWNGVDENCDGVVDGGFDTTIDLPSVAFATGIWPVAGVNPPEEFISIETQPRLVWAEDRFLAVWTDMKYRLRVAQFGPDGALIAKPDYVRKPVVNYDVAWTGTRLGIVYQDEAYVGYPSVRLMIVDRTGLVLDDVLLVAAGMEPKVAWGQDRFGVVWKTRDGVNALRFQRFSVTGVPLSEAEVLENSGGSAAIAFSGTTVIPKEGGDFAVTDGVFGIAYDAYYGFAASGDILLASRPREAGGERFGPVRVNQHDDPYTKLGTMPTIAGNPTGFAVAWHTTEKEVDRAQARFFSLDKLESVQEFIPDWDAARSGHLLWTGGEFVMANDNRTSVSTDNFDVHFRRFDPSANTHLLPVKGAWSEVNLRDSLKGSISVHPDVVSAGDRLGVIWVEADPAMGGLAGEVWFASISHR